MTLRNIVLALTLLVNQTSFMAGQENSVASGELQDSLLRYESLLNGKKIITERASPLRHKSGAKRIEKTNPTIWVNEDGDTFVAEYSENTIVMEGEGETVAESRNIGHYSNSDFSVSVNEITQGDDPTIRVVGNTVGFADPLFMMSTLRVELFGFSELDGMKFSRILETEGTRFEVAKSAEEGVEVELTCQVPRRGEYRFGFVRDGSGWRLVLIGVIKNKGDLGECAQAEFVFGEPHPDREINDSWSKVTGAEIVMAPIEYTEQGLPYRVACRKRSFVQSGQHVAFGNPDRFFELHSIEDSDREISEQRVDLSNVTVPDGVRVGLMRRTGMPVMLKDGRLVALIDGNSVDQIKGTGFRSPPGFVGSTGFYVLVGSLVLLAVLVVVKVKQGRS
jgi:hypothetical protein